MKEKVEVCISKSLNRLLRKGLPLGHPGVTKQGVVALKDTNFQNFWTLHCRFYAKQKQKKTDRQCSWRVALFHWNNSHLKEFAGTGINWTGWTEFNTTSSTFYEVRRVWKCTGHCGGPNYRLQRPHEPCTPPQIQIRRTWQLQSFLCSFPLFL